MSAPDTLLQVNDLRYRWPGQNQDTLKLPALTLAQGEHLFLQGASGSGKTTLLNLLAGIYTPQAGQINWLGQDITQLSASKRDRFRADHFGIIFQQFNLLPYLSVAQNIALPLNFSKTRRQKEPLPDVRIDELMDSLNLSPQLKQQTANQLSIGQQQRVAVARALMGKPDIIIADEPTSALDANNRDRFIDQLFHSASQFQTTVLFVSHDASLANHFARHIDLQQLNQATGEHTEVTSA